MASRSKSGLSEEAAALSSASLWKGENDSDVEQMETYDGNPLADAEAWTEAEAYSIYRAKLVNLRSLYTSQLTRLKHSLAERRREFILEWTAAGGDREDAVNPSRKGSVEDLAYRSYRRRSGEEAVLERRQKQRQIAVSIEFFSRKDLRNSSRAHHQHLLRLQGQYMPSPHPTCSNVNCNNKCLPFSTKCHRHICGDPRQLLYTSCTYIYPSGTQCSSPVPVYLNPPLCGGHCDTAIDVRNSDNSQRLGGSGDGDSGESGDKDSAAESRGGGGGDGLSGPSDGVTKQSISVSQPVTGREGEGGSDVAGPVATTEDISVKKMDIS